MSEKKDVIIIGAGSAGLYAISEVSQKTKNFVLINGGNYGTTCARVGCMPSKAIIGVANTVFQQKKLEKFGQSPVTKGVELSKVLAHVRALRDQLTNKVIKGMSRLEKTGRKIDGYAEFVTSNSVKVNDTVYEADKILIATGSRPVLPSSFLPFKDYILTTDELFEQEDLPKNIAVIGLGAIGLEIGQALSRLGLNVTGFEMLETIGGLSDPKVNEAMTATIKAEFPIYTQASAKLQLENGQLYVLSGEVKVAVDKVIASLGRRPNLDQLKLDKIGISLDERGLPKVNEQTMQIEGTNIFFAGDITGKRMFLHEAADEGRIAGYNSVNDVTAFKRKTPIRITFTSPNIAVVGKAFSELNIEQTIIGECLLAHNGRAIVSDETEGVVRLYADKKDGKIIGVEMASAHAESMAHSLAWAISQNLTAIDMLKMPFYHPVMEEALQTALYGIVEQIEKPDYRSPILESELVGN